ncbi:MAG: tryptophan synthase subunit beta like protein [Alphaproteobacteria bacterium]
MPFVKRNAEGKILAIYGSAIQDGLHEIRADDVELIEFLAKGDPDAVAQKEMIESDLGLARVLEDLIDLLIEKGTFRFTDLPDAAQRKLLSRRGLRKEFAYVETLFGKQDDGDSEYEDYESDDQEGFL